ncbi:MAG: ParB/RepB/Spo0J family partition protein [Eubacteriales bacterium]|nr:ParB/RepB/Spo0J family partition protein [Eubacteriales bacterium]
MAKTVLGKGMGSLLNTAAVNKPASGDVSRETSRLNIFKIEPNRNQPRKEFKEEALNELADSIKKYGIIEPIVVKRNGTTYQIIAGERRWRAAKLAGLTEVPVIVKDVDQAEAAELSLIENLQREDLNPVEEAYAYEALINEYGFKQEEIAEKVSKNRSTITNSLRLLKLGDEVLSMLSDGAISAGHARALLQVEDEERRIELAKEIVENGLSVRDIERLAKEEPKAKDTKKKIKLKKENDPYIADIAKTLTEKLGTKASIKPTTGEKGKIEIEYYSYEALNSILERIR